MFEAAGAKKAGSGERFTIEDFLLRPPPSPEDDEDPLDTLKRLFGGALSPSTVEEKL